MKLKSKQYQLLGFVAIFLLVALFSTLMIYSSRNTFADSDEEYTTEQAKYVVFYDEGEKFTIKTDANTVKEAIERTNIIINDGDIVEPGLDTVINANNYHINIYRARPVIVKDGTTEKYIMTASYDGKTIMKEAGITVYDGDKVEVLKNNDFLEVGVANTYQIIRNGGRTITVEEEIPFAEKTEQNYDMEPGKQEVKQLGEIGVKQVNYEVLYIDGKEVSREKISEEVIRQPVDRIVVVGAQRPVPSIRPEFETCANWARQAGVSEVDLPAAVDLIYRESGCRVNATNSRSGAYGIPQALPGSKMASAGSDWQTNPVTQIRWMIGYVTGRYGGWQQALNFWHAHGWY